MLGDHERREPMFYYVRMEELVPDNHLLRLVDRHIDFSFMRKKVKHLYSHTGRPSIDPEILLRMLLIGYLYGITSERRLCEDVKLHIGYRWFVGLTLEDKVPDHSTFSKNRHDRFSEGNLFQEIFDAIVQQCISKGLLTGKHLTVDSTYVKANASLKSLEPIVVDMSSRGYIETIEKENPIDDKPWEPGEDFPHKGKPVSNKTHRSQSDPDSRLGRKSNKATTQLYHAATYVMDNKSRIIVGADVGEPDKHTDCERALQQIRRVKWVHKLRPETLGADKGYSAGEFIHGVVSEGIDPHIPIVDHRRHNSIGIYTLDDFSYNEDRNVFICPEGRELRYWGVHRRSRQHVYRARTKDCAPCSKKDACTKDTARSLSYHIYEESIQKARDLNKTAAYRISQRMRKKIEELFGEGKEFMGLRQAKFRRRPFVREQVLMTAAAQNIKRMVKMLARRGPERVAAAVKQLLSAIHEQMALRIFFSRFDQGTTTSQ